MGQRYLPKQTPIFFVVIFAWLAVHVYDVGLPLGHAQSSNQADAWESLVDDSTLGVVKLDLQKLDASQVRIYGALAQASHEPSLKRLASQLAIARDSGATRAFGFCSTEDRWTESLVLALEFSDSELTAAQLSTRMATLKIPEGQRFEHYGDLWVLGSDTVHQRVQNLEPVPAGSLQEALAQEHRGEIQIAFRSNALTTRAVIELYDEVPEEVVRGFRWALVDLQLVDTIGMQVTVQLDRSETAQTLEKWSRQWVAAQVLAARSKRGQMDLLMQLLDQMVFRARKDRWIATAPGDPKAANETVPTLVNRELAENRFRAMALAMHNYESGFKTLPPVVPGPDNRSKLGWRVTLLPYLGYTDLYDQFHHDEPWDSPHNLQLVPKMPMDFWMPGSQLAPETGKTCIRAPAGEHGLFYKSELTFRDMIDGSSNTIMLVESDDAHAQIWTKPGGFEVPQEDPVSVLGGHYGSRVVIARADGSTEAVSRQETAENWRRLFTPRGREVIRLEFDQ